MKASSILIVLNLLCFAVLYYVNFWNSIPETTVVQNSVLLDDLATENKALTSVEISSNDGIVLKANLSNGRWIATHLSEEYEFPLNELMIKNMIVALASAEVHSEKTKKSEKYSILNVEDINQSGAKSRLIKLETSEKTWSVIVGKQSEHRTGTFVRLPSSRTSLLINKDIELPDNKESWLQQPILNISGDTLSEVAVIGRPELQFQRDADGVLVLPEGVEQAIAALEFDSVLPRNSALLNWIIQTPSQQIELNTDTSGWLLSFYRNEESNQVWLTVDHDGNEWQEHWAFSVSDFVLQTLLNSENLESEASSF